MATVTQNKSNHTRLDPAFHYFLAPILFLLLIATVVQAIRFPTLPNSEFALLVLLVLVLTFKSRIYSLKVQDRVIRLEERLRLGALLDEPSRGRVGSLTESQLIALRFASDAEVTVLAKRAMQEELNAKTIKAAIQNWRPDHWRV